MGRVPVRGIDGRAVSAMTRSERITGNGPLSEVTKVIITMDGWCSGWNGRSDLTSRVEFKPMTLRIVNPSRDATLSGHVAFKGLWGVVVLSHGEGEEREKEQQCRAFKFGQVGRTAKYTPYVKHARAPFVEPGCATGAGTSSSSLSSDSNSSSTGIDHYNRLCRILNCNIERLP